MTAQPRIDFAGTKAALSPEIYVPQWLPGGKRVGYEYVVRNPTRADGKAGSFSINLRTGRWADWAVGSSGGDIISLFAYLQGISQAEAARELASGHSIEITPQRRDQANARKAEREAAKRAAAIRRAKARWDAAQPCGDHSYLSRKGVRSYGLRIDRRGNLLIPILSAATGELQSVQRIAADGAKRFAKSAPTGAGHFTIPGTLPRLFCEGYATGATLREATGREIVVCFTAGNLPTVTPALAQPGDIVAADHDKNGAGQDAAGKTGLPVLLPPQQGHDWNDHAAEHGLASVAAALAAREAQPAPPAAPDVPVFDAWELPRAPELADLKRHALFKRLTDAGDPAEAASFALTAALRLFAGVPVQTTIAEIIADIAASLPIGIIHPDTLAGIGKRLEAIQRRRKAAALAPMTIPTEMARRHRHERGKTLPDLSPDDYSGVIVVRAPMGSGKTRRIGAPFVAWAKSAGLLPVAICHRVSLVADMARALDLVSYTDADENDALWIEQRKLSGNGPTEGLAVCLPSITSPALDPVMRAADVLFIDEISQVLRFHAAASHCRTKTANNEVVFRRLVAMVRAAKCVIVADAGADARTIAFLEYCRPGEQFRIIDVDPADEGIAARYTYGAKAPAGVVTECLLELTAGGKVWIAVESARRSAQLGGIFSDHGFRALAVHANNKGNKAQAAFLANPEAESLKYDVVIASPVIGSGLSIEHRGQPPHFTLGAEIGGGHAVTAADAMQALRRVRYLRRYVLGILPNSATSGQTAAGIERGWAEAGEIESAPALANEFSGIVAGIKADEANAKADFAAALIWQLEAARWTLECWNTDAGEADAELKLAREAHEVEWRAAVIAAPAADPQRAKELKNKPARTEAESIEMDAHLIRDGLGIADYEPITDEALDVWDHGAGLARLDRLSAALFQSARRPDDAGENASSRRYDAALIKAYAMLLDGIDVLGRMTEQQAAEIVRRAVANRFLLARLGIVPRGWGEWREDRAGNLLPFAERKFPQREVSAILERMGLKRRAIMTRLHTDAPISSNYTISASVCGPAKNARVYAVDPDSLKLMQKWAERRASRNAAVTVNAQSPLHPLPPAGLILRDGFRARLSRSSHTATITTAHTRSTPDYD